MSVEDVRRQTGVMGETPYLLAPKEVAETFETSTEVGLSHEEVARRRERFGWNELRKPSRGIIHILFRRLTDGLTLLLIAAAAISMFLREPADTLIISIVIFFDLSFGLLYESYSEYKIDLIKKQVPRISEVLREGTLKLIPVRELVPGDVCLLRAGERVPADIRLIALRGFRVDESLLTGEAGDAAKSTSALTSEATFGDQRNMAFSGTLVTAGSARGIVVATGEQSVLGILARRVVEAGAQYTPLERRLRRLGLLLGSGVVLVSLLLVVGGVLRGEPLPAMFRQALTFVVSAIPEDLTLILTVALAVGARRLLARRGVVRHLTAAETLGDATVVCTDKTGTLTTGELALVRIEGIADTWTTASLQEDDVARHAGLRQALTAALAGADVVVQPGEARGSAHDRAIARVATVALVSLAEIRRSLPLFDTLVFDPVNRYRASLHDDPARPEPILFAVGAPDVLLPRCVGASEGTRSVRLTSDLRQHILDRATSHADAGKRVLAVVRRHLSRESRTVTAGDMEKLAFLALLVFEDPLRPDSRAAVRELQRQGVRVLLLTGDHPGTATAVARSVGILRSGASVLVGTAIGNMNDQLLRDELRTATVLARVDPFQKERVVQLLQQGGEIVGMVGDGVNDAVALRRADLGVAVGSATDVAKDASDLVLLDNSIATLTAAVREGRRVRETVRTVLAFLFATNMTEVLSLVGALVLGIPLPFVPAMLLWINIITDGTADIALALEPASTRSGDARPGRRRGIFRSSDVFVLLLSSLVIFVPTMIAYLLILTRTGDVAVARTVAFVALSFSQLLAAFSYRSLDRPLLRLNPLGNMWLLAAVAFSTLLLVVAVVSPGLRALLGTVPLSVSQWALAGTAALTGLVGLELRKAVAAAAKTPRRKALVRTFSVPPLRAAGSKP
jgi:P-type Ca2+ transporter type 2C